MIPFIFAILLVIIAIGMVAKGTVPNSYDRNKPHSIRPFAAIPFILGLVLFFLSIFTTVDGGHVGVTKTFGKFGSGTLSEGLNIVAPWTSVEEVDVRTAEYTMTHTVNEGGVAGDDSISVVASDQVVVNIDATVLYHVDPDSADKLLKTVGPQYQAKLVRPSSRQLIRDEGTKYGAIELVTDKRVAYATAVKDALVAKLEPRGIIVDDVQIRDMTLPTSLQEAVNNKATAAQLAEQKINELTQAQLQAEIDRTKAQATADSQQIVACGGKSTTVEQEGGKTLTVIVPNRGEACDQSQLTAEFLQSEYIKAIHDLVDSENNTVLVVPTDSNLTPILNLPTPTPAPK